MQVRDDHEQQTSNTTGVCCRSLEKKDRKRSTLWWLKNMRWIVQIITFHKPFYFFYTKSKTAVIQIASVIDFESWLVGIHKRVFVLTTLRVKLTVITLHFRWLKSPAAGHFDPGQSYFSCQMFTVWNGAALYKCAKVTWLVANCVHEHTAHAQFMHTVPMVPMVIYTFAEEECNIHSTNHVHNT